MEEGEPHSKYGKFKEDVLDKLKKTGDLDDYIKTFSKTNDDDDDNIPP